MSLITVRFGAAAGSALALGGGAGVAEGVEAAAGVAACGGAAEGRGFRGFEDPAPDALWTLEADGAGVEDPLAEGRRAPGLASTTDGFLGVATIVDADPSLELRSASIFARTSARSLSHFVNFTVTILRRPLAAAASVLTTFLGRLLFSSSSLLRFLAGLGRFSACLTPFGCWLVLRWEGAGDIAGVAGRTRTGETAMESDAGFGRATLIEGCRMRGGMTTEVEAPCAETDDGLLCNLILTGSTGLEASTTGSASSPGPGWRGVVR